MYGERRKSLEDFGDLFEPEEAAQPILAAGVRAALTEWLSEIWSEAELTQVGLTARKRAIFDGPPGVGKTTLAHHLSARLGLRMLAVRPERVISKWVGETGWNLGSLFDLAADPENPIVIFLDEFDAISRQRRKSEQASDDSRNEEVNTLLQRIEQHKGFLIAATNYADHIDQAIWRRFDMHITLELPGPREREHIVARYLAPYVLPSKILELLSVSLELASPALIRSLCEGVKRQIVIGPKIGSDMNKHAVFGRLLTTIHPHPDLGKPRLWSLGIADHAIEQMPWPLARDLGQYEATPAADNVVTLGRRA